MTTPTAIATALPGIVWMSGNRAAAQDPAPQRATVQASDQGLSDEDISLLRKDMKFELLKEYAANYNSITDEQADIYVKGRTAVEESILKLRLKYMPIFRKVLSGKTAARFIQIDWRLGLALDLQLNSQVPIIEP